MENKSEQNNSPTLPKVDISKSASRVTSTHPGRIGWKGWICNSWRTARWSFPGIYPIRRRSWGVLNEAKPLEPGFAIRKSYR